MTINKVLLSISSLLTDPNPDDPLNHEAAQHFREDVHSFKRTVDKTLRGGMISMQNYTQQFPRKIWPNQ